MTDFPIPSPPSPQHNLSQRLNAIIADNDTNTAAIIDAIDQLKSTISDKFDTLTAALNAKSFTVNAQTLNVSLDTTSIVNAIAALAGTAPNNTLSSINQSIWNLAGPAPGTNLTQILTAIFNLAGPAPGKSLADLWSELDAIRAYSLTMEQTISPLTASWWEDHLGIPQTGTDNMLGEFQALINTLYALSCPCDTSGTTPQLPPAPSTISITVNDIWCQKVQYFIHMAAHVYSQFSYYGGSSGFLVAGAIVAIVAEVGSGGFATPLVLGIGLSLLSAGVGGLYALISSDFTTAIQADLRQALYATTTAAAAIAAWNATIEAHTEVAQEVRKIWEWYPFVGDFNNLFGTASDSWDLSGYDGTICAPPPTSNCVNLDAQVISSAYRIDWTGHLPVASDDSSTAYAGSGQVFSSTDTIQLVSAGGAVYLIWSTAEGVSQNTLQLAIGNNYPLPQFPYLWTYSTMPFTIEFCTPPTTGHDYTYTSQMTLIGTSGAYQRISWPAPPWTTDGSQDNINLDTSAGGGNWTIAIHDPYVIAIYTENGTWSDQATIGYTENVAIAIPAGAKYLQLVKEANNTTFTVTLHTP